MANGPGEEQVAAFVDPPAGDEVLEQGPLELAGSAVVDILDAGADMAQPGGTHPGLELLGAAAGVRRENDPLDRFLARLTPVDQEPQRFGVAEIADVVAALQLGVRQRARTGGAFAGSPSAMPPFQWARFSSRNRSWVGWSSMLLLLSGSNPARGCSDG